jgi:NAD+--asparagine ADP-ribosyltransferase
MKFNLILPLICITLILTSCGQIRKNHVKRLDTENRTDVKSKYNDDNSILVEGKEYLYKVVQQDTNRTLKFDLTLKMIPGNYSGATKIKYKHYYKETSLTEEEKALYTDTIKHYKWDITSAHESVNEFLMFPPRSYTLKKLEIAPYP